MGRGRVLEWRLRAMARLSMSRRVRDACCFAKFNSQTKACRGFCRSLVGVLFRAGRACALCVSP